MFQTFKNAWKIQDIRKKLLFTFFIIALFRIGSQIPVPFIDSEALKSYFSNSGVATSLLGYFNLLSGESFSNGTLFALSISPYITASIVIQLLAVAIPALERLSKSGPEGQEKLQNYTRILTIVLALVLSYGYYTVLRGGGDGQKMLFATGTFPCIVIMASLTAGACIVMWLGEKIDNNGIGNGISMILFAGILARGPVILGQIIQYIKLIFGEGGNPVNLIWVVLALAVMIFSIWFVIYVTNAERRLPVQYAKRQVGRRIYGGNNTFLPLKLNMTGVMPIIFAQSIVMIPATLALIFTSWSSGINDWFSAGSKYPFYAIAYLILIVAFAYFYSEISFNPMEVASNLQKNGGTILGHRPGKATADYIRKVLGKVTFMGAVFLSIVAIFPLILVMISRWIEIDATSIIAQLLANVALTGTSLLIVVGVALETTRDLEAQITMRNYKGFLE